MNPQDLNGRDLYRAVAVALSLDPDKQTGISKPHKIPRLLSEIGRRSRSRSVELVWRSGESYAAYADGHHARGNTTNEALARLLLMVAGR
jgi:hypothetical protein